jgi:hypothetical protein
MDVLSLLDRPIAYHRVFVTVTGSVTAAVLLSQAVYWSRRTGENGGWWWKTAADWTEETGLTRREQETARAILRELGFWQEEKRGIPARLWFFLDVPALERALRETSMAESAKLEERKAPNWIGGNRHSISENTAEIISISSQGADVAAAWQEILPGHRHRRGTIDELRQLAVELGAGPGEVVGFAAWFRAQYPRKALHPLAALDHFPHYVKLQKEPNNGESRVQAVSSPDRETSQQRAARQFAERQRQREQRIREIEEGGNPRDSDSADAHGKQSAAAIA